jgi:hypothetical protein
VNAAQVASAGCAIYGYFTTSVSAQSTGWGFFWHVKATATGAVETCGGTRYIEWTSVTPDSGWIGFPVSIQWCGAWPNTWVFYDYRQTNYGANYTVTAVANGVPIAQSHGIRASWSPNTLSQYGAFGW